MKKQDRKTIFNISIIVSAIGIIISLLIAILLGYDYKNLVYPLTAICPVLIFLMIPVTLVFLELSIYKWSNNNSNKIILIITIITFAFTIILCVMTPKINTYIQKNKIMYIEKNEKPSKENEQKNEIDKEEKNLDSKDNQKTKETTKEETNKKEFKCNETEDYEIEYNTVLDKLYPYGYKVHRITDYTLYREEETSCIYKTSIKITNMYGSSSEHTMYIGTNLDKQNKKESLKNIMIDNIYVYGE